MFVFALLLFLFGDRAASLNLTTIKLQFQAYFHGQLYFYFHSNLSFSDSSTMLLDCAFTPYR